MHHSRLECVSAATSQRFPHFVDLALAFLITLQGQEVMCAGEVPPVRIHTCLSKCFADREERRGHLLQPTRQEQGGDNGVMAAAVGEGLGQLWSSQGKNGDGAAEDWTWRKDLSIASHCCQLSDNMHE